jgi:hypothetical protein
MRSAPSRFHLLGVAALGLLIAACGSSAVTPSPFVAADIGTFPKDGLAVDVSATADADTGVGTDAATQDGVDGDAQVNPDATDQVDTGPGQDQTDQDSVDTGPTGCTSDADCTVGANSTPTCKKASCDKGTGKCSFVDAGDGATCDDGSVCTTEDVCKDGACAGTAKVCDDGNPCTDDACDAATGCTTKNNTVQCNDKDECTNNDSCLDGKCAGKVLACDDGNPCTDDTCDSATGCKTKSNTVGCDDGNACTLGDKCAEGVCLPGAATSCDDGNPCTDDTCDAKTGCANKASAAGTACNDNDACTSGDACQAGKCASTVLSCDDKNPCTTDTCDKTKGCVNTNADGVACDDGNTCTSGDQCAAGQCKGVGKVCDDNNLCTDDSCKDNVCLFAANAVACDDNNPCTQGDQCANSGCQGGKPIVCDDKNVCTTDTCDKSSGTCQFAVNAEPCDDGSLCTTGDVCAGSVCSGKEKACDDGKPCTVDACDDTTGNCKSAPYADGTACDDGTVCTQKDLCAAGACIGQTLNCDDTNPCTTDSCDAAKGCQTVANTAPCDDGNACTAGDACQAGACLPGAASAACDDSNACTTDSCDPAKGCVHTNNTAGCDDGNACTTGDTCKDGSCGGAAKNCDDSNSCTNDTCDAKTGCVFTNNAALCTDGNVCTTDDVCKGGTCAGTPAIKCDDFNACTTDVCDAKLGCVYKAVTDGTKCDDGNGCTTPDACAAGKCTGPGKNCDDSNVCTSDSCSNNICTNAFNKNPCNDGSACTLVDNCDGAGKCVGGTPQKCNDGNPCTTDSCDTKNGGCVFTNNTAPCDDGKFCTDKDACANGKCASGGAKTCDDANVCTNDSCDAVNSKCINAANTAKCEDGNGCTLNDTCAGGTCKAGAAANCNDDNPCTADSCDKATGICGHTVIVGAGACPIFGVPATFPIDNSDPLWFGASNSTSVKWQTDATPNPPGKLTGAASLNFNNGSSYADGGNTVKGTATGAFLVDATKVSGALLTLVFYSYADVESLQAYDQRFIDVSSDGFVTTVSQQLDNTNHQKSWYMETVNLSKFIGKQFQVRFRFDSKDGNQNGTKGWFVDEVNVYAGPVVTVDAATTYTDKFEDNGNGWQFTPATGGVTWAIDATPAAPVAFSGKSSLNFNNGTNFSASTAVSGNALSPVLNFEGLAKGTPITLSFKEWIDVETPATNTYDRRYVQVSGDAFATVPLNSQLDNTAANLMKTWHWNSIDLSQFAGLKVRLTFRFDSIDAQQNGGAGWFIDDAQLDVKPMPSFTDLVSCGNAAAWTIAKTGTTGTANWAVDNTGITAFSPDCSLNFNAPSAADNTKFDFACKAGSPGGSNVAGTATSPKFVVAKPVTVGAKTLLTFKSYSDVEQYTGADLFYATVKDTSLTPVAPVKCVVDKSATNKTWKDTTCDISSLVGKTVVVVFTFDSVDCISNATTGVAVDDVIVRADK